MVPCVQLSLSVTDSIEIVWGFFSPLVRLSFINLEISGVWTLSTEAAKNRDSRVRAGAGRRCNLKTYLNYISSDSGSTPVI